jgi:hypothetical protein
MIGDTFSFGMVGYFILTGSLPFAELDDEQIQDRVRQGERPLRPQSRNLSDSIWELIVDCWNGDPFERPLFA